MNDEKLNNELDNVFRTELENLPEEKPSADDWQQMNKRIQSEGLLENNSNGRKYFLLVLLFVLLSGLVFLPFLMKDKNENVKKEVVKPLAKAGNINTVNENAAPETKKAGTAEEAGINPEASLKNKQAAYAFSGEKTTSSYDLNRNTSQEKKQIADNNPERQETDVPVATASTDSSTQNKSDIADEKTNTSDASAAQVHTDIADEKNIRGAVASADTTDAPSQELPATAQNDSTSAIPEDKTSARDTSQLKRFRLGIYVSLDYNYYALKENQNVAQAESDFVSQSDLIEGDKWGGQYTIGIMGGYLFTRKLSVETGVFYSQKKKLHADIYTPAYSQGSGEEMFSDFTYDYKARYIELYGRVKYYLRQKKNSVYAALGAGGSYNLPAGSSNSDYFSRTSYGESSSAAERVTLDASSVGVVLVVSAGVEIPLGTKWDVYIEPAYRHSFNPVIKHPTYDRIPVEHFLRSISLATGLMYKF